MPTPPILTQSQEREAILTYLCGLSIGYTTQQFGISEATLRISILRKRSREWHDPLVEFYRPHNHKRNSAHMYLTFQGPFQDSEVKPTGLIDLVRDRPIYDAVRNQIYVPAIERVIQNTALQRYTSFQGPYENLIEAVFGPYARRVPPDFESHQGLLAKPFYIVWSLLNDKLLKAYNSTNNSTRFSLEDVVEDVENTIVSKVKDGALGITQLKKDIIHEALATLTEREQKVLGMWFGLDGYEGPKTLGEIGTEFGVTGQTIRVREARAIRKLRHPARARKLGILMELATDADVKANYENVVRREQETEQKIIQFLRLSSSSLPSSDDFDDLDEVNNFLP